MILIDGKQTAATIKAEIKEKVEAIVAAGGKRPHLAAILVGHDGGSDTPRRRGRTRPPSRQSLRRGGDAQGNF